MNLKEDIFERLTKSFARAAQDFDDLQNEMAGRETGRIARFLGDGSPQSQQAQKQEKERTASNFTLQALLANERYRKLYEDTQSAVRDAQNRVESALERIEAFKDAAISELKEIEENAAKLPDGTAVFKDSEGNVRRADGSIVDPILAASILWRSDEPSFEDFQNTQTKLDRIEALEQDALQGQNRIGELQGRLEDETDPPDEDELDRIQKEAEDIAEALEQKLAAENIEPDAITNEPEVTVVSAISIPEL